MTVLRMRIFMWAAVALLAVVVLQLRPSDAEPARDDRSHRPINGKTSQGEAIWAVARDGQIEVVELAWRFTCSNGATQRIASRFHDGREPFRHTGRRFNAVDISMSPPDEQGRTGHFHANVEGDLSADGDAARGRANATATWFDAEHRPTVSCESGPVRWSVKR